MPSDLVLSDVVLALEQIERLTAKVTDIDFWADYYNHPSYEKQLLRVINRITRDALNLSTNGLSPQLERL